MNFKIQILATLSLLAAQVGCGGKAPLSLATSHHPMNGDIAYSNCSSAEIAKIAASIGYLLDTLPKKGTLECVKDAVMSPDNGKSAETIVAQLQDNLPTSIECIAATDMDCTYYPGLAGCAPIGSSDESLQLDPGFIKSASKESLAGLIAHELLHNKGYDHFNGLEYDYSVCQQVRGCVVGGHPLAGIWRSTVPRETELARAGGGGGAPFNLGCASANAYVRGFSGAYNGVLNGLSAICSTHSASGAVTSTLTTVSVGTPNDASAVFAQTCAEGSVVVGIHGRSGLLVDQLGMRCQTMANLKAGKYGWMSTTKWAWGGGGGAPFERQCPTGMAVKRIVGRAGASIDQLGIVCQSVNEPDRPTYQIGTQFGTAEGFADDRRCTGRGVMVGLYGRSGSEVDRLGGICLPLTSASTNDFDYIQQHLAPANGGKGGGDFKVFCPSTQALVGLQIRSGTRIDQVAGVCAHPSKWVGKSTATATKSFIMTAPQGGSGGSKTVAKCPVGYLLTGLQSWSSDDGFDSLSVVGLRLVCRKF